MYKMRFSGWLKHLDFIIADLLCMQLAYILSYLIRHGSINPYASSEYLNLAIVFMLVDLVVSIGFDTFKNVLKRGYYIEFISVIKHVFLVETIVVFYLFATKETEIYSRISFYAMIPIYGVFTYIARLLWKKHVKRRLPKLYSRAIIIAAPSDMLHECITEIASGSYDTYRLLGVVATDADMTGQTIDDYKVLCAFKDLDKYVQKKWCDEVFLFRNHGGEYPLEMAEKISVMGVTTHIAIANKKYGIAKRQFVENINGYVYMTHTLNYASSLQFLGKRLMDILGGLLGCIATVIIMIFIGPIIYIKSPGSIFFVQERIGQNGKPFRMYKFRSMYLDAEDRKKELMAQNKISDGMMFKMDFDPRIIGNRITADGKQKTGIGQFIRNHSLDEFPQFFNVLKGDMSLVGTRPPTLDEWEKYEPHHRARMSFRPGITGLWQVSGRSNITDFEEVVRLDTEYIDNWSFGEDVRIIVKTAWGLLGGDGAR